MVLGPVPSLLPGLGGEVHHRAPVGYWWAYVDATDGEVLARTNHAATFDIPTTVKSDIQLNYTTDPQTETAEPGPPG